MPIDGKGMSQLLWDAIVKGVVWMFTIKYPDDTQFAFWILSWLVALIPLTLVGVKGLKRLKDNLFD